MHVFREWFGGRLRLIVLFVLLFAVSVCGVSIGLDIWNDWNTPPEIMVAEALRYAVNAPTYCYSSEAVRVHEGNAQVITYLDGEKCGENVHLHGIVDVLNMEIDIYQIGDVFYRQDIVDGTWMKMTGQNIEATEYLLQEINPLGCLLLDDTVQVIAQGKEKINGIKCKKYQVQSSGESTFLTSSWNEFYYTVWIDKKHRLQQAEIIADNHENGAEQLRLTIQFDWDTPILEINAPI